LCLAQLETAALAAGDARVVAGSDLVRADGDRLLMKEVKFYMCITKYTWARCGAAQIALHERRDDLLVEIRLQIQGEMRNAEFPRNSFGVSKIVDRAAPAIRRVRIAEIVVHLHRQTDHLMSAGLENVCGR